MPTPLKTRFARYCFAEEIADQEELTVLKIRFLFTKRPNKEATREEQKRSAQRPAFAMFASPTHVSGERKNTTWMPFNSNQMLHKKHAVNTRNAEN